jgi:hypothetical protein
MIEDTEHRFYERIARVSTRARYGSAKLPSYSFFNAFR